MHELNSEQKELFLILVSITLLEKGDEVSIEFRLNGLANLLKCSLVDFFADSMRNGMLNAILTEIECLRKHKENMQGQPRKYGPAHSTKMC